MDTSHTLDGAVTETPQKWVRALRTTAWIFFALGCLITFTLLKLPEDRIKNFVFGTLTNLMAQQGYNLSADSSDLSIGLGVSYHLKQVRIMPPPPSSPIFFEEMTVRPKLFSLLFLKGATSIEAIQKKGSTLKADISSGLNGGSFSIDAQLKAIDVGALGIVPALTQAYGGLKLGGIIDGEVSLSGDPLVPSTFEGFFTVKLSRVLSDAQMIFGFQIPRIYISEGFFEGKIEKSKLIYKRASLGKVNSDDDIRLDLKGETLLSKSWQTSTNQLLMNVSFSQNILSSFSFIDTLIGGAKQADGTYSFEISGPVLASTLSPKK